MDFDFCLTFGTTCTGPRPQMSTFGTTSSTLWEHRCDYPNPGARARRASHTDARTFSCTVQTVHARVDRRIKRCGAARLHNSLHHAQRPTVTALRCAAPQSKRGQRVHACSVAALLCQRGMLKMNPLAAARQRPTILGCTSAAAALQLPMSCLTSPARCHVLRTHLHLRVSDGKASKGAVCAAHIYVQAGCASCAAASGLHTKHHANSQLANGYASHVSYTETQQEMGLTWQCLPATARISGVAHSGTVPVCGDSCTRARS